MFDLKEHVGIKLESSAQFWMLGQLQPKCCKILFHIAELCAKNDIKIILITILRRRTSDTGMHQQGRAIDFILEHERDDRKEVINWLLATVNKTYVYREWSPFNTLIYHKVGGELGQAHFHLQVSA